MLWGPETLPLTELGGRAEEGSGGVKTWRGEELTGKGINGGKSFPKRQTRFIKDQEVRGSEVRRSQSS